MIDEETEAWLFYELAKKKDSSQTRVASAQQTTTSDTPLSGAMSIAVPCRGGGAMIFVGHEAPSVLSSLYFCQQNRCDDPWFTLQP